MSDDAVVRLAILFVAVPTHSAAAIRPTRDTRVRSIRTAIAAVPRPASELYGTPLSMGGAEVGVPSSAAGRRARCRRWLGRVARRRHDDLLREEHDVDPRARTSQHRTCRPRAGTSWRFNEAEVRESSTCMYSLHGLEALIRWSSATCATVDRRVVPHARRSATPPRRSRASGRGRGSARRSPCRARGRSAASPRRSRPRA